MIPSDLNIRGGMASLAEYWRRDVRAGFSVSLIAFPLCIGIAMASGFPPLAGLVSAIVGGLVVSRINGAQLTIAGPAAGLAMVLLTAVETLGSGDKSAGYRHTLAAIVCVGSLQILLGLLRGGRLALFFPGAIAHGLLASIGLMVIVSQVPVLIGTPFAVRTTWQSLLQLPVSFSHSDPASAAIGLLGLAILIIWPRFKRTAWVARLPAPIVMMLAGIALGEVIGLEERALYRFPTAASTVAVPLHSAQQVLDVLLSGMNNLMQGQSRPDFRKIDTLVFWEVVLSLFLIGSLESLLATAAVDRLVPGRRRSNLDRELFTIGIGNTLTGLAGAMPMVSEIVRSSANIGYGARSAWSNFFHGLCLLAFLVVLLVVPVNIPLASLAALLIYVGYRLALPVVFAETWEVGREQRSLCLFTVVAILTTHILSGVALALALKVLMLRWRGANVSVRFRDLFKLAFRVTRQPAGNYRIQINGAAVFSNIAALKRELTELPVGLQIVFDLRYARLIDHTVMVLIDRFQRNYIAAGGRCEIRGLDHFESLSDHPLATRRRKPLQ
jgi:MFS superfamily sulfate permease-like transporter